jgi:hypothetical protein
LRGPRRWKSDDARRGPYAGSCKSPHNIAGSGRSCLVPHTLTSPCFFVLVCCLLHIESQSHFSPLYFLMSPTGHAQNYRSLFVVHFKLTYPLESCRQNTFIRGSLLRAMPVFTLLLEQPLWKLIWVRKYLLTFNLYPEMPFSNQQARGLTLKGYNRISALDLKVRPAARNSSH